MNNNIIDLERKREIEQFVASDAFDRIVDKLAHESPMSMSRDTCMTLLSDGLLTGRLCVKNGRLVAYDPN